MRGLTAGAMKAGALSLVGLMAVVLEDDPPSGDPLAT